MPPQTGGQAVAPRLSVIIPFYDETAFVGMAVRSVLAQDIAGVQIILVNDNPEHFDPARIAALDLPPQVQVVHQDRNLGLSAARNAGLSAARGELIGFLDADDYYVADGLSALLTYAEETRAEITHAQTWFSPLGSPAPSMLPRDAALFGEALQRRGLRDCEHAQFITSSWSSLYRADFLRRAGLAFDQKQRKFEDRLFVLSAVTAADRISTFGRPVRVWRRRSGSISTAAADPAIHLLQVQLLEKCLAVMASWTARSGAAPRFMKREVFNTLSRLIWDMDLMPHLADPRDPVHAALAPRVAALMSRERLGQSIFDDPIVSQISRVGRKTRRGVVGRAAFFELQQMVREGDFAAARRVLETRARPVTAVAVGRMPRLVLHLGSHKTGTTALQHWCNAHRAELRAQGIVFPRTGLLADHRATRADGLPGHQGLLAAIRRDEDEAIWRKLEREVRGSRCETVLLSCENFPMPLADDRAEVLPQLLARLSGFADIHLFAFQRRPDIALDRLYREVVAGGLRGGSRSHAEFALDFGPVLADLPGLFGPFEALAGRKMRIIDYDAAVSGAGLLPAFAAAAGFDLPQGASLPARYHSPHRLLVEAARIIDALLTAQPRREAALRDFFLTAPVPDEPDAPIASPAASLAQIGAFRSGSGDWAAARGYAPDWAGMTAQVADRTWTERTTLPAALTEALLQSCLRTETPGLMPASTPYDRPPAPDSAEWPEDPPLHDLRRGPVLRLRLRPWAVRLLDRMRG